MTLWVKSIHFAVANDERHGRASARSVGALVRRVSFGLLGILFSDCPNLLVRASIPSIGIANCTGGKFMFLFVRPDCLVASVFSCHCALFFSAYARRYFFDFQIIGATIKAAAPKVYPMNTEPAPPWLTFAKYVPMKIRTRNTTTAITLFIPPLLTPWFLMV